MLRIKEIIMVINTTIKTTTSTSHPETINTISLLDRTSHKMSLELSREEVDMVETIVEFLRILAQVLNLVTLILMISIIVIFAR